MLHRIHDKLGTVGLVVAIVALIAALGGSAWAALPGLNAKQKKEVKKIAKKYAKRGLQGVQGVPGTAGANGAAGTAGSEGARGPAGEPGEDGACSVSVPKCVLPPGATETGVWSFIGRGAESFETEVGSATSSHTFGVSEALVSISFPLRLPSTPQFVSGEGNWVLNGEPGPGNPRCPGSWSEPEAEPGELCIYVQHIENAGDAPNNSPRFESFYGSPNPFGFTAGFHLEAGKEGYGNGTWAVTAPCPENEEGEEEEC